MTKAWIRTPNLGGKFSKRIVTTCSRLKLKGSKAGMSDRFLLIGHKVTCWVIFVDSLIQSFESVPRSKVWIPNIHSLVPNKMHCIETFQISLNLQRTKSTFGLLVIVLGQFLVHVLIRFPVRFTKNALNWGGYSLTKCLDLNTSPRLSEIRWDWLPRLIGWLENRNFGGKSELWFFELPYGNSKKVRLPRKNFFGYVKRF